VQVCRVVARACEPSCGISLPCAQRAAHLGLGSDTDTDAGRSARGAASARGSRRRAWPSMGAVLGRYARPRPGSPASHDHFIFGAGRGFMGIACLLRLLYWFMDMTRLSLDRLLARSLARSLAGTLACGCLLVATLRVLPPSSFGALPLSSPSPFPHTPS